MNEQIISNIKTLGIDMINEAGSGHPGIVLGAAPTMYTLFAKHMNISFNDKTWVNRDRFILSAGHGSALLYATLYLAGYDISLDDLKNYRKIYSKTPGHPELNITPGVEMTTGPLGQGLASAVGIAMGEKFLENKLIFPKKNFESKSSLIDYNIYVLCSDGDLMEGVSYEACSLAGNLKLDNLIVLYDSNHITLDGNINKTFNENILKRFEAAQWNTIKVKNGNNIKEIDRAITKAKYSNKPTIIEINTIIGKGSLLENTNLVHGKPLSIEDITQIKQKSNIPNIPFYTNEEAKENMHKQITERSNIKYDKWSNNFNKFNSGTLFGDTSQYNYLFNKKQEYQLINDFNFEEKENFYLINQKIMDKIAKHVPNFFGGNADLSSSTKIYLNDYKDYSSDNYTEKNISFGVREHAMGAIMNGLALANLRPFGATYLVFSDYLKPAMRLSSLMNLPVVYIFTHDSLAIGKDGPTHQPIEQLAALRLIPNMTVLRPADHNELIGCWNIILKSENPCSLILGKNEVEMLNNDYKLVENGAYIIEKEKEKIDGIIIATGYETHIAVHIAKDLYNEYKLDIRVVSMPSQEIFLKQNKIYQDEILPAGYKKIVIEPSSSSNWYKFVYNEKYLINTNDFGICGSKDEVLRHANFDYQTIKEKILNNLK